jgi:CRP-like cAMP-binding protein
MRNTDVVFRVTEVRECPCYKVGDEFRLSGNALLLELKNESTFVSTAVVSPPFKKQSCRKLIADIVHLLIEHGSVDRIPPAPLNCSGCSGTIRVETLEGAVGKSNGGRKARHRNLDMVAGILSNFSIFQTLDQHNLKEIVSLLKLRKAATGETILKKGAPAQNLYILLSGVVDVLDEEGLKLSSLRKGDVFGEMSLISGEPVGATVKVVEPATIIYIRGRDFKQILNKFPSIQMYLAKLLAQRLAKSNLVVAEEIASGMIGRLSEMPPAELFQTLNLNQKTGRLLLNLADGDATILFRQGELVSADYGPYQGKEAFFAVLREKEGRFKFHPHPEMDADSGRVIAPIMELLLEGLRRVDEENGLGESPGQLLI